MRSILKIFVFGFIIGSALIFTSCEEDIPGGGTIFGPSASLQSGSDLTIDAGATIDIQFSATAGDNLLESVTITENGSNVAFSRITINGSAASSNPILLFNNDKNGVSNWTIEIINDASPGTSTTYSVIIADESGSSDNISVVVNTPSSPPTFAFVGSGMIVVPLATKASFKLNGSSNAGALSSIDVQSGGQSIDPADVFWNNITMSVSSLPFTLPTEDQSGFSEAELIIMSPDSVGSTDYDIILTDEFGQSSTITLTITTESDLTLLEGVLLNAGGPAGTGGLDLDTGEGTGSSSADAEIKDNGIDTDLQQEDNWIQTISPINGSSMRYLVAGQNGLAEGFTFETVNSISVLNGLFDNGLELEDNATNVVQVGDMFIVNRDDKNYLLLVTAINITMDDNNDFYTFSIKQ